MGHDGPSKINALLFLSERMLQDCPAPNSCILKKPHHRASSIETDKFVAGYQGPLKRLVICENLLALGFTRGQRTDDPVKKGRKAR